MKWTMVRGCRARLIAAGLLLIVPAGCGTLPRLTDRAPLAFTSLRARADFDTDGDGSPEIVRIRAIPCLSTTRPRADQRTILILIEERLWREPADPGRGETIRPSIEQCADDLMADGYDLLAATASLYRGKRHKDGRIVLALRRYLAAVRQRVPGLRAVVLIGDFPEAYIVRQHFWKKRGDVTLNAKKPNERRLQKVHYWACVPEPVADRADIVLADLDGRWDRVYQEAAQKIPYFIVAFARGTGDANKGTTDLYELGTKAFEDFFYVNDGRWKSVDAEKGRQFLRLGPLNEECNDDDLRQLNPMARPEIYICRINPRHVAVELRRDVVGMSGEHLSDKSGTPQAVAFADEKKVPHVRSLWARDERMERRLLNEFFRRNHRYRSGEFEAARKPACLTMHWGSAIPEVKKHFAEWQDFDEPGYDLRGKETDLLACIRWLKRPALLRVVKAHSDPWGTNFAETSDLAALQRELGGAIWEWRKDNNRLVPGFNDHHKLDLPEFQALYRNGVLPDCATMWLHTGCQTFGLQAARTEPYSHPMYGNWQHGEGILYYLNGLVMIARAKTFNDEPRDLFKLLAEGKTWGEAWMHYFQVESADPGLRTDAQGIRRKKAYFWSTIGDATLTMFPRRAARAK